MQPRQALFPFDASYATRPWRMFASIALRVYAEVLLFPVISLASWGILAAVAARAMALGHTIPAGTQTGLWLIALFPLVIATEEFSHAAACLGRGKPDRLQGLVVGRFYAGKVHLSFGFAGIDIRGRMNLIDKLYISAGGPMTTFLGVMLVWLSLRVAGAPAPLRTALLILAVVPLVALIPNKTIIQSDGYAVRDALHRMAVPRSAWLAELLRSVKYPLRWLLRPNRSWPDDFLSPSDAYRAIETALANGDTQAAVTWYRRLIRIDPYNGTNHNNLAWLLADLKEYPDAYRHARRAKTLMPSDSDVTDTWKRLQQERPKGQTARPQLR